MKRAVVLHAQDNVCNVLDDITRGEQVKVGPGFPAILHAGEDIPFGFKMAIRDIPKGEAVIKYGEIIGRSSMLIEQGMLVHVHNLEGTRGRGDDR